MTRGLVFALLCGWLCTSVQAAATDSWGQWRGPLGTGEGPKADPPVKWSATENIKWKVKIPGRGTGTPVIWGNQVFVQTAIPAKKVADYPSAIAGPVLAAQQEQPGRPGQGPGEGRRRGGPGGGGGFGRGEKPSEE